MHIQVCSQGEIPYRGWNTSEGRNPVRAAPNTGGFGSWGTLFTYKDWLCVDQTFDLAPDFLLYIGYFWGSGGRHPEDLRNNGFPTAQYQWKVWVKRINEVEFAEPLPLLDRSTLSSNQPKNGLGDARECAISACSNTQVLVGDPIDVRTGNFEYSLVDLSLSTPAGELSFQRSYASLATDPATYPTDLSPGWTHNHDIRLLFAENDVWFKAHTLNQYRFFHLGDHLYVPYAGVLASLTYDPSTLTYILTTSDQSIYTFDADGRLLTWRNERGFGFDYTYSAGRLARVTEPLSGRFLQFTYQDGHLVTVSDHAQRQVSFAYDQHGDLVTFTDVLGQTWGYLYTGSPHRLSALTAPSNSLQAFLTVYYDAQGRAVEQLNGKGERIVQVLYHSDGTRTVADALGRIQQVAFDERNLPTQIIDPSGYLYTRTFDTSFRLSSLSDTVGRTLLLQWSPDGTTLTRVQDAAGYQSSLQYDAHHHLTQVTDPLGRTLSLTYEGPLLTHLTRQTSTGNLTTTYTYTTSTDAPQPPGLLKSVTDARQRTTTFIYDPFGQLIALRDAQNHETRFVYDDLGRLTALIDPLQCTTRYEYDLAGRLIRLIQNNDPAHNVNEGGLYNLTTEFSYDAFGRLSRTTNPLGATTTYQYDEAGRLVQIHDAYNHFTTFTYNAAGQIVAVTDPLNHTTEYVYDHTGRLEKVKNALGQEILTYAYNADGTLQSLTRPTPQGNYVLLYETYDALKRPTHISDNEGHEIALSYDAYGNLLARTDALGRVTRYEYNDLGLLAAVTQNYLAGVESGNDRNVRTQYTYDAVGNLIQVQDANGHITTFEYDSLDRLVKIIDPLGQVTEMGYDAAGNRRWLRDASGQETAFEVDALHRLTNIDYPEGTADVHFTYDALGRLTGMDDGLGHTTWEYDALDRLIAVTNPLEKTVRYAYDAEGKRTQITFPALQERTLSYHYNSLDLLDEVWEGSTLLAHYTYDLAGRLSGISLANGITSTLTYDRAGQLTHLIYQKDGLPLADYTYTYNEVGNLIQARETLSLPHLTFLPLVLLGKETDTSDSSILPQQSTSWLQAYPAPDSVSPPKDETFGNLPDGVQALDGVENLYPAPTEDASFLQSAWEAFINLFTVPPEADTSALAGRSALNTPSVSREIFYEYDALDRLTAAISSDQEYRYTYDPVGNRTAQILQGVTLSYTYDAANRLLSTDEIPFTWDANGNLLSDGSSMYTYDAANRLVAVSYPQGTATFHYDGLGNRYRQTVNGQETAYTLDVSGDLSQVLFDGTFSYAYGMGRISREHAGSQEFFLADALGSVRQMASQNGVVLSTQSFDPFGALLEEPSGGTYGFTGEWHDPTDLIYLRARY
ncbi:MAG: DUF6531 domain-containing protein, partial [Anaerolinea sp.]